MFKRVLRVGFVTVVLAAVLIALVLIASVLLDDDARSVLVEKTLEGMLGGTLFGMLSGLAKWYRVRERFTLWRFRCVIVREVKTGFWAGALVGLVFAAVTLLA